jgi:GTP-binding protein
LPVHVLLTKSDKLKRGPAQATLLKVRRWLDEQGLPGSIQLFSAVQRVGVETARERLDEWLDVPDNSEKS